jgi:hypothetical protein|eukprot:COSAG01_NODE_5177_length_4431_cov_265.386657_4_plen_111_part_00
MVRRFFCCFENMNPAPPMTKSPASTMITVLWLSLSVSCGGGDGDGGGGGGGGSRGVGGGGGGGGGGTVATQGTKHICVERSRFDTIEGPQGVVRKLWTALVHGPEHPPLG